MTLEMPLLVPGKLPAETTVAVAMSGGVDSSVAAALCAKAGYKTVGMTLQLWDYTPASNGGAEKKFGTCCALDDVYDARRVCQTIGIPHYVLNYESEFKAAVIDDFVETYVAGATPIPCVRCNQRIKFDALLAKARGLGADILVTGHYVRKVDNNGQPELHMGVDPNKDQSYYLFTTTPDQLAHSAFPLGEVSKDVTRDIAVELGLHVAQKKDSYDICFVPGGDYRKVVKKFAPQAEAPGNIILKDGTVMGQHDGVIGYTIGQRKGLPGGFAEPMFVTEIRASTREVVIGPREDLKSTMFTAKELDWLATDIQLPEWHQDAEVTDGLAVTVKVRAQHVPAQAWVHSLGEGRIRVDMAQPEEQITPGQAVVIYHESRLLGGAWIEVPEKSKLTAPIGEKINVAIQPTA